MGAPVLLNDIPTFRDGNDVNVIIETTKGSRNKVDYAPELGVFELAGVLPEGSVFPYDFGFIPSTQGEDGDPLDVLVLLDESAPVGCLISSRLIGVIEANQTEKNGAVMRNDRLLAVATRAHTHSHVKHLKDLRPNMTEEIEHFFVSYNETKGKVFKALRRAGPEEALQLVHAGVEKLRRSRDKKR
jgi:inorganic pyrophosphatase